MPTDRPAASLPFYAMPEGVMRKELDKLLEHCEAYKQNAHAAADWMSAAEVTLWIDAVRQALATLDAQQVDLVRERALRHEAERLLRMLAIAPRPEGAFTCRLCGGSWPSSRLDECHEPDCSLEAERRETGEPT